MQSDNSVEFDNDAVVVESELQELANKMTELAREKDEQIEKQAKTVEKQLKKMESLEKEMAKMEEKQDQQQVKMDQLESLNGTLGKLVKGLAEKMNKCEGQHEQDKLEKEALKKLLGKLEEKLAKSEEKQAKDHGKMEELASQNGTMMKLVKELVEKTENLEVKMKLGEEKEQAAEYSRMIGMPIVINLKENYEREGMLNLLKHGNGIGPKLYVQQNQELGDGVLFECVVDLMANAEKPEKLLGDLVIEYRSGHAFKWPQNMEMKLKEKKSNMDIKLDEASSSPSTSSGRFLAEYELVNKECRFQVLLYYKKEDDFNKWAKKFVYRRLD